MEWQSYKNDSLFDEMFDEKGCVRAHWQKVYEALALVSLEEMARKQSEIDWHLEDNGVTYNVYNAPAKTTHRQWHLDPIPFVVEADEWDLVKKGAEQRAVLLDLILRDIYGKQMLFKDKILPPEVIFTHKGFIPHVYDFGFKESFRLYFYALDMARGPDGHFWAVSDRTQAPSGLGYAIENRLTMNSAMQEIYQGIQPSSITPFIDGLKALIQKLSYEDLSKAVLLTPGTYNETYFEHAFLSSFLDITLVQGNDLLTKNGALWLKSLSGLKPISTLLRRVDDRFCDPLELKNDSKLGVAGLVDVLRQQNLHMINPIGSAIVENSALNPFMPAIARYFLDEDLVIPQIATWWCGQEKEKAFVLENLDRLVIKKSDRTEGIETYFGKYLDAKERQSLEEKIIACPHGYIAQEEIGFSTTPYYGKGTIEPRNTIVRSYAFKTQEGYRVMEGGLVRVSASKEPFLVSSQKGASSKDLWIVGKESSPERLLKLHSLIDISLAHMPTSRAENLFWLGRYLCRFMTTLRFVRYVMRKMLHHHGMSLSSPSILLIQKALTHLTLTYPGFLEEEVAPLQEITHVIKDTQKQGSLAYTFLMLENAHMHVKNVLEMEAWKVFDQMNKEWFTCINTPEQSAQAIVRELDTMIMHTLAYKALVLESMPKEQGRLLFDIGYAIEESVLLISKARSLISVCHEDKALVYELLETMLFSSESFNAYRTHYKSSLAVENIIAFLFLEPRYAKSLVSTATLLLEDFKQLPKAKNALNAYEEPIFKAYVALRLTPIEKLLEKEEDANIYGVFDAMLVELYQYFSQASIELSKTYFAHHGE